MSAAPLSILLLTPQLPYPPHQGTTLRNFSIVRGLAQHHRVTLLSFVEAGKDDFGPLADLCHEIVTVPLPRRTSAQRLWQLLSSRRPDMAHRLADLSFDLALDALLDENTFDIVQIEGIELGRVLPIVRAVSPASRIVFDNHNAETALQQRALATDARSLRRWPAALYSLIQVGRLRRFERDVCLAADAVTVVSDDDAAALALLLRGGRPPVVIPNCIDVAAIADWDGPAVRHDVLFVGKMDYRPNIDAVLWFADAIWPLVRARRPDATFAIVGQQPHARLDRLRSVAGITVAGAVADVQPYLHGAGVVALPLRMGSGTRLKLIEALAAARPVVSTTLGAAGFAVADGRELRLADEPAAFAAAICALLDDPAAAAQLGATGRRFADGYDWRVVVPRFDRVYRDLLDV